MTVRIAENAIVPIITRRELPKKRIADHRTDRWIQASYRSVSSKFAVRHALLHEHGKDGDPSHQMNPQPTPLLGADHPDTRDHRFDHTQRAMHRFLCLA